MARALPLPAQSGFRQVDRAGTRSHPPDTGSVGPRRQRIALRTKPLRDVFVDGHVALDYREAIPRIVKAIDLGGLVQDGRIAEEDMDTFVDLHDYAMRKRRESDYEQKARIRAELLKTPASRRKVSHASCPTCVERRRKATEAEA